MKKMSFIFIILLALCSKLSAHLMKDSGLAGWPTLWTINELHHFAKTEKAAQMLLSFIDRVEASGEWKVTGATPLWCQNDRKKGIRRMHIKLQTPYALSVTKARATMVAALQILDSIVRDPEYGRLFASEFTNQGLRVEIDIATTDFRPNYIQVYDDRLDLSPSSIFSQWFGEKMHQRKAAQNGVTVKYGNYKYLYSKEGSISRATYDATGWDVNHYKLLKCWARHPMAIDARSDIQHHDVCVREENWSSRR